MIALLLTLLRPANTIAQDIRELNGTITDSKRMPAAGVTVSVKGANYQTLTNEAEAFTLRAPQIARLVVTGVNFETTEIKRRAGRPAQAISLKEKRV
jgi:hypothetical protein